MPKFFLNLSGKSSKIVHRGVLLEMTRDAYRGMASLFVFPSFPEQNRSACCASAELSSVGDYCCRNLCLCLMIVFENRFSAIISQTQTICDCNRLPSLCSRLLPPFDSVVGKRELEEVRGLLEVVRGI